MQHTLPPETYAVVFFWRWLVSLRSYSFWRRSNYFLKQLNGCSFRPGWSNFFKDLQFSRRAVCHVNTFIKKGTVNHFGRSEAWNGTHRGRCVFSSLGSAASLSISSLSLCLSPCVVCGSWLWCVSVCVSVFLFVFGASAMKVNSWTCALATASDIESAWRSKNIRTRRMVNCA